MNGYGDLRSQRLESAHSGAASIKVFGVNLEDIDPIQVREGGEPQRLDARSVRLPSRGFLGRYSLLQNPNFTGPASGC